MRKNNKLTSILSIILALIICLSVFAGCDVDKGNTETSSGSSTGTEGTTGGTADSETSAGSSDSAKRFDYFKSDVTPYINVDSIGYDSVEVSISKEYKVDDAAVATYIRSLCEAYATVTGKITDRAIVNGDTVYLYYEGILDGEAFDGGSNMSDTKPAELVIGSGTFIPGFEEALIGIVPGETSKDKTVPLNLTFPADYHASELAGKSVVFNVYVEYIAELTPAEYNEAFVTETVGFKTDETDVIAAFNKYIEEYLSAQRDEQIRNAIWEELLERVEIIKYPDGEYEYYYDSYIEQIDNSYKGYVQNKDYYATYYGLRFDSKDEFARYYFSLAADADWEKYIEEESKICVKQDLIYHAVSKAEEMKVTSSEYQNAIKYYVDFYSSNYGYTYTEDQIEANLGSEYLKRHVIFEKVSDLLYSNTVVNYAD